MTESQTTGDIIVVTDGGCLWQAFWASGHGWIAGMDDGVIHVRLSLKPTHWTPLPAGPAVRSDP